jgi:type IV secretion system protein VirD4
VRAAQRTDHDLVTSVATSVATWVALPAMAVAAVCAADAYLAAATAMALSGNGVAGNPSRAPRFLLDLVHTGDAAGAWVSATGGRLGPAPLFWVMMLAWSLLTGAACARLLRGWVLPGLTAARPGAGATCATARQEGRIAVPDDPARRPCRLVAGRGQRSRRLLAAEDCISAVVFGPNGSGKSTGLIAPNVLEWAGPMVMTTTKPQDVALVHARRSQLGPVWVIAPGGCPGFPESGWSPVAYASDDEAADRMAEWLCEASGMARNPRALAWVVQARKLIRPLLLAAHCSGGGIDDFIRWVYEGPGASEEVRSVLREHGHDDAAREYASTWALHDDGVGSVLFTAYGIADAYSRPGVRASARRSQLDVAELTSGTPSTLVIVAPESDADRYAPMLTALVAAVIHAAEVEAGRRGGPLAPRLLLALDEAGNVFRFPRLANLLTTARGNGIQLLLVYHDLAQLEEVAGRQNARTVMSNAKLRILLPGVGDLETLKYFTDMFGRANVVRSSTTRSAQGQVSRSVGEQAEDLAPLHVLQQLARGSAVIQYENLPPMRVGMRFSYSDKRLRRLARADGGDQGR